MKEEATSDLAVLVAFLERSRRLFVLTGAGCSTESGIPDYRDLDGEWKHKRPISHRAFVSSHRVRQRYWARSAVGWRRIAAAVPNGAHRALARLEAAGRVVSLVTQNVDRLHSKAGSARVIDLHGRLDRVECLGCGAELSRAAFQRELERLNPGWQAPQLRATPDGDADLGEVDYDAYRVPGCPACGGVVKPAIVFFGATVPAATKASAWAALAAADGALVVGSSLMVMSGYRFARAAVERGLPLAVVNLGRSRADGEATLKVAARAGDVLPRVVDALAAP